MKITALQQNYMPAFRAEKTVAKSAQQNPAQSPVYDKNPIKKGGEKANAILATVVAGLGFGARLLFGILDDGNGADFLFGIFGNASKKMNQKAMLKNIPKGQQDFIRGLTSPPKPSAMKVFGGAIALMVGFVGVAALLYTLYNTPKAMYDAKVNTFKKGKDMDVYIRGNAVEKELYDQMNDKAKDADAQEKERLKLQYAKLQAAKNTVPDFVKVAQPK